VVTELGDRTKRARDIVTNLSRADGTGANGGDEEESDHRFQENLLWGRKERSGVREVSVNIGWESGGTKKGESS